MNTQDQIWLIQNQIHELKLNIASGENINYKKCYEELFSLEKILKELCTSNECD
jgi:hypothetical protein